MKRLLYIALIAFACSFSVTSCTEEEVAPNTEADGAGGSVNDVQPR